MNIFLAGIIQGSLAQAKIHNQDWREPIKAAIARHLPEAEVYCHYSKHPNSITYDLPELIDTLNDGIERAGQCDVLVAYLPSASMGTAIEMYRAWQCGAVILTITPMTANWVVRAYSDRIFPDVESFEAFLDTDELHQLITHKRRTKRAKGRKAQRSQ
jgi:hypothetical protein